MLDINKKIENGKALYGLEGRLDTVTAPSLEDDLKETIPDFIIKTKNTNNEDELTIWFSERTFVANYTNLSKNTLSNLPSAKPENDVVF